MWGIVENQEISVYQSTVRKNMNSVRSIWVHLFSTPIRRIIGRIMFSHVLFVAALDKPDEALFSACLAMICLDSSSAFVQTVVEHNEESVQS